MAKIFSQLISAQLENKASDYSAGTLGRIWVNSGTLLAKFDDGAAIRVFVTTDNTQTLTNKTISSASNTLTIIDNSFSIKDNGDNTKVLDFQCSGITTGSTRTWTVINRSGSVVVASTPTSAKGDILADTGSALTTIIVGTDGQVLTADSASTPGIKWATATAAPTQSYEIANLGIATASVGGTDLTVTIKQYDGSAPSTGAGAVKIGFRSSTATTGQYAQQTLTSATAGSTLTVPSTATLGFFTGSVRNYAYIYAIDNAGTIEIGIAGCLFDEGTLQSSTILDTASDSNVVLYSTTARSSKAIRLIGRVLFTIDTAGTWDEAGDEISLPPFAPSRQFEYGTASATNGTLTVTTFGAFTNAPTISFTARSNGMYKIEGVFTIQNSNVQTTGVGLQIVATTGSPTLIFNQSTDCGPVGANRNITVPAYGIWKLVAGTAYVFTVYGQTVSGDTLTLANASIAASVGHNLIATQLT